MGIGWLGEPRDPLAGIYEPVSLITHATPFITSTAYTYRLERARRLAHEAAQAAEAEVRGHVVVLCLIRDDPHRCSNPPPVIILLIMDNTHTK